MYNRTLLSIVCLLISDPVLQKKDIKYSILSVG